MKRASAVLIFLLVCAFGTVANALPVDLPSFVEIRQLIGDNSNPEPSFISGDIIYSGFETNLPGTLQVAEYLLEPSSGAHYHGLTILNYGGMLAPSTNYFFNYTMSVNPGSVPFMPIIQAELDADGLTLGSTFSATETIIGGGYSFRVNTDGVTTGSTSISPQLTSLEIANQFTFTGPFSSVSNRFLQYAPPDTAPVPEPATMLLLASGLVGLVGVRRKFKK